MYANVGKNDLGADSACHASWQHKFQQSLKQGETLVELLTPRQRDARIDVLLRKFARDAQNTKALATLVSLLPIDDEQFHRRLGMSRNEAIKKMIALEPRNARYYSALACLMDDQEVESLPSGERVSKQGIKDLLDSNQLDNADHPAVLFKLSTLTDVRSDKDQYEQRCYSSLLLASQGQHLFNFWLDFAASGCKDAVAKRERAQGAINAILKEFGSLDELRQDVPDESVLWMPCLASAYHGNYTRNFRCMLPQLYTDLGSSLEDGETATIQGQKLSKEQVLQQARSFPDDFVRDNVFLVKGKDEGRNAWYYLLVRGCKRHFQDCLKDSVIHLEDHGEIISSAYGDEPDEQSKKAIHKRFDIPLKPESGGTSRSFSWMVSRFVGCFHSVTRRV